MKFDGRTTSPRAAPTGGSTPPSSLLGTDAPDEYQSTASATDQVDLSGVNAMTEHEVAQRLRVSVKTLRDWRFRGTGPSFHKFGRSVRYMPDDLDAYVRRSKVVTESGGDS